MRGAFDRSGGLKGIADHSNKTRNPIAKTTPIVMGESSSGDAATRSRYAQIHISERKRIGDGTARYTRVQQDCKHWYLIGRWLMENRAEFAKDALQSLALWMKADTVRAAIPNERVRLVYGVAFACYHTAASMLGTITVEQHTEYQAFLLKHGAQGLQDVVEETFLHQFLRDIVTFLQRGKINPDYFAIRHVQIQEDGRLKKIDANAEGARLVCYLNLEALFDSYQQHRRAIGEGVPLKLGDVKRELEREPYWVPRPKGGDRVHRISMAGNPKQSCAVLFMDREPGEAPEELRSFLCPIAEDLINILEEIENRKSQ